MPVLSGGEASPERPPEIASASPPPAAEPEPEPPPAPDIDPDRLIGLDPAGVRALLGEPSFIRREKPMQLWRYRHGGCALALFLYAGKAPAADAFRVRHIESWAPGGEQTPPRACLNAIARRAGERPAG